LCDGRKFEIKPDLIGDFRNIQFPDNSFYLVVFDPPHFVNIGSNSWMAKKYGKLEEKTWRDDLAKGFREAFRILKPNGTLVFKWNEEQIKLSDILKLADYNPLFGNRKDRTHFVVFLKNDECKKKGNENEEVKTLNNQIIGKNMKVFVNQTVNIDFVETQILEILQQFEIDGLYFVIGQSNSIKGIDFERLFKFQELCKKYSLVLNVVINNLSDVEDDIFYLTDYADEFGRYSIFIKYSDSNFNLLKQILVEREDVKLILDLKNPYQEGYKNIGLLNYKNTLFIEGKNDCSSFRGYNNKKQKYNIQKLYDDNDLKITDECLTVCKDSIKLSDVDDYARYLDRIELEHVK
jgi:SAM-dependent methyltransferase